MEQNIFNHFQCVWNYLQQKLARMFLTDVRKEQKYFLQSHTRKFHRPR